MMEHRSPLNRLSQFVVLGLLAVVIGLLVWNRLAVQAAPLAFDIGVTKTDSPDPVLVGSRLTYVVAVRNVGTVRARSVVMTDTLPAGVTFASVSTSKGVCTRTGSVVRCTLGNLNKNANVRITVAVTPTIAGVITNTAIIDTPTGTPNPANATVTTTVTPKADLVISKSDAPDPVLVGNLLSYTLVVTNAGPSNATDVVVTDTLPLNVMLNTASTDCNPNGNRVVCAIGAVASGSTRTITITVTPNVLATGVLINSATVKGGEVDPVAANNTASITTTVSSQADLAVSQSAAPVPAFLDNPLVYTLTLTNNGPSPASNVILTNALPAGVILASASADCPLTGGLVVCTAGTLGAGTTLIYTLIVTPTTVGSITNTLTAAGSTFDPNLENNTNLNSLAVVPAADLVIVKTSTPNTVLPGDAVTYTLAITNNGPSTATGVVVTDALPAGVLLKSFPGACSGTSLITCNFGAISSGGTTSFSIAITTTSAALLTNIADVASSLADPNPANNISTRLVAVNPVDLAVNKIASADSIQAGDLLTYTITVANNGPLTGTNVLLTDTLPSNVTFSSVTSGCSGTTVVSCSLGDLNPGSVATVTLVVTPTATGVAANTAIASADQPDPDSTNNTATATTAVNPVDLALSKTAAPEPVYAGDSFTYTLVVTNNGPSSAANVIVTDDLPVNVTLSSASLACSLMGTGRQVLCSAGTMSNGGTQTFTITVNVDLAAVGIITNSATVDSDAPDVILSDNTALATTTVLPKADLVVTLSDSPDPVYVGSPLDYVINIANNGPAVASNVLFTQTLPAGVTVGVIPAGCAYSNGMVTCALGALPAGAGMSLVVEVYPTTTASSLITSTATVKAAEYDPNAANSTAVASTTVVPVTDLAVTKVYRPDPARSGLPLIYTIVVTNAGPSNATGVLLTDTLPAGVTFGSAPGCSHASGIVTCALDALAGGLTRTVVITVTPISAQTSGTFIENTVDVVGNQFDPDLSNNTFLLETAVDPGDLSVVKTATPNPVVVGSPLTYTLVVSNAGPFDATGVFLYDTLPLNVSFRSATAGCSESGGLVICSWPNLAAGANTNVSIVVTPTAVGLITNAALVDANEADNNPTNDTASVNTTVIGLVDLALSKTTQQTSIPPGRPITYTITLTNTSQLSVLGATLIDTIPSSVINPAWTCTATPGSTCGGNGAGNNLVSTLNLAGGGKATYTVIGVIAASARGVVTNTATFALSASYVDSNSSNNTGTAVTKLWTLLYLPLMRR